MAMLSPYTTYGILVYVVLLVSYLLLYTLGIHAVRLSYSMRAVRSTPGAKRRMGGGSRL